jgi:UPF0176 protein
MLAKKNVGCCSTECATIIHLSEEEQSHSKRENGNKIFKKENQTSLLSKK